MMLKKTETRRSFFQKSLASSIGLLAAPSLINANDQAVTLNPIESPNAANPIWRNRREGMSYRMLGRTGMMVSEIVLGTFPFTSKSCYPVLNQSLDRGVNYFDSAFAYSSGAVENTLGTYFKDHKNRDDVFISTKLSAYYGMVDHFVSEILKELPSDKQKRLRKKAQDMIAERAIKRPGYHFKYFGGQDKQFDKTYFRYAVLSEYGLQQSWKKQIKDNAFKLLQGSLKRLQTDYVDVLYCPHGSAMPEMMDGLLEEIFSEFKQKGLIRASAVSFHNDVTSNLLNANQVGYYDVAMFAYNIANHAALESVMYRAKKAGMGLIAMKVAKLFSFKNQPNWQIEKLNDYVPHENLSNFAKAYLWALQNPNLSCCVSQMETTDQLADNLQVVGKKLG